MSRTHELAKLTSAAFRAAVYLEALAGPRIGECFGLQLGDFFWKDSLLWVTIERQMLQTNAVVPWVKTDASYRRIPLAPILSDYLIDYCHICHGIDLRNPDPALFGRQLIVNTAGRDTDGSFLAALRTNGSVWPSLATSRTEQGGGLTAWLHGGVGRS